MRFALYIIADFTVHCQELLHNMTDAAGTVPHLPAGTAPHPTYSVTTETVYGDIVRNAITLNAIQQDNRRIPGLSLGAVSGSCWEQTAKLQVSYTNLMR